MESAVVSKINKNNKKVPIFSCIDLSSTYAKSSLMNNYDRNSVCACFYFLFCLFQFFFTQKILNPAGNILL